MGARFWHCISAGSCITAWVVTAEPYLQAAAALVAIATGIKAWRSKK